MIDARDKKKQRGKNAVEYWRKYSTRTTNLKHKAIRCVKCGGKKPDGVDPSVGWMWRRVQFARDTRMPKTESLCPTCVTEVALSETPK